MTGSITIRATGQALTLTRVINQEGTPVRVFSDRAGSLAALPVTFTGEATFWLMDGPVRLTVTDSAGNVLNVDPVTVLGGQPRIVTPVPTMAQLAAATAASDARTVTLQSLAADYQGQLAASLTDRQALHGQVDQIAAQLATEVTARTAAGQQLSAALADAQAAIAALQAAKVEIRTATPSLPALALGNTDLAVTWSTPMPNTTYTVLPTLDGGASVLGKLSVASKAGTKTKTGVTLTVTNTGLVAIALGSGSVNVLAYTGPN